MKKKDAIKIVKEESKKHTGLVREALDLLVKNAACDKTSTACDKTSKEYHIPTSNEYSEHQIRMMGHKEIAAMLYRFNLWRRGEGEFACSNDSPVPIIRCPYTAKTIGLVIDRAIRIIVGGRSSSPVDSNTKEKAK